ncbi:uncharacterized protein LOC122243922 [Penaeus japonicus]|uniref:uncharacterized protein LOC122243922 n=1 Tax=Penaeus japonicus TaxID=27405 RepID=UPI001C70CEB9|nr:uncharacterized protein LOC122243922 [Penaeus japonicus]
MNFRVALLVALAVGVCSAQAQSPLDPLLDLVTAEEVEAFMRASSINMDTCIAVLKNISKCKRGAQLFLRLANSLADTGYKCMTCSADHQVLVDRTVAKVRASSDCQMFAQLTALPNLC